MSRTLILLGAEVKLDSALLSDRLNTPVKQNSYTEGDDDIIFVFSCPNKPIAQEVDLTIKVGPCSEHDDFEADTLISEEGDFFQEIVDLLSEMYNSEVDTDELIDGE
jgi:hypothetical protein